MIKLRVEDYCHGCPEFDPVVIDERLALKRFTHDEIIGDQYVECKMREICGRFCEYVKSKTIKDGGNE